MQIFLVTQVYIVKIIYDTIKRGLVQLKFKNKIHNNGSVEEY